MGGESEKLHSSSSTSRAALVVGVRQHSASSGDIIIHRVVDGYTSASQVDELLGSRVHLMHQHGTVVVLVVVSLGTITCHTINTINKVH